MALRLCTECNSKLVDAKVTRPLAEQSHLDSTVFVDEGECEMCGTRGTRELNSEIRKEGFSIKGSVTLTPCEHVDGVDIGSDGCLLCHFNYGRSRHFGPHPGSSGWDYPFVYCTAPSLKVGVDPVEEDKVKKVDQEETLDIKQQICTVLTSIFAASYVNKEEAADQLVELFKSFYDAKVQDSGNLVYSQKDMEKCYTEMAEVASKWVKVLPPTVVHGLSEQIFISGIVNLTLKSYSSPENMSKKIVKLKEIFKGDEGVRSVYMDLLKMMKDEFSDEIEKLLKDDDEVCDKQNNTPEFQLPAVDDEVDNEQE